MKADISSTGDRITVDGDQFQVLSVKDPAQLPWQALGVDVVFESTGLFTNRDAAAKHLAAGAKKVVITAPAKSPDLTLVLGVNEDKYDAARRITSSRMRPARRTAWRRSPRCCTSRSASRRAG